MCDHLHTVGTIHSLQQGEAVEKQQARTRARGLVASMGPAARRDESHAICAQLPTEGTVLAFMPLLRWEPDIRPALRRIAHLILPRVTPDGLTLHACAPDQLVRAPRYGILELSLIHISSPRD